MDSDVEEVTVTRPRVIRRPVPVRNVSALHGAESESDDDDFFRLHQKTLPVDSDSSSNAPSPEVAAAEPNEEQVVDLDSDSDVDSASDIETNAVVGEKRKHTEDAPNPRSRSVSLTPPPTAPRQEPALNAPAPAPHIHTYDLDSDADTRDLDPSLRAVIQSTPTHTRTSDSPAPRTPRPALERVQIEFQFMYDPEFLTHELPLLWDPRRWGRVRSPATIEKKLQEHVAVVVFTSDIVATAVAAYSDIFVVDVLATDPVLMDRITRVFPTSTLASLGDKLAVYIKVFPRSVYNRRREREAVEMARVEGERKQAERDMEMVRELQMGDTPSESVYEEQEKSAPQGIRIKIRDKAGRDTLLLVTGATKVQAVVENYCKLAQVPPNTRVRLEFDDEALDPNDTIGSTEIEDDDMLTAFCI
ncbi:hypothetical protein GGH96_006085 [Coemansia sp. RSA 1972]|nr:hypothetical protein GGH96_006085 [Coemansia sp. RSA 1972]